MKIEPKILHIQITELFKLNIKDLCGSSRYIVLHDVAFI